MKEAMKEFLVRSARGEVDARLKELKRQAAEPWRKGRPGPVAEIGRRVGAGLAAGAFALGVTLAVRAWARGGLKEREPGAEKEGRGREPGGTGRG